MLLRRQRLNLIANVCGYGVFEGTVMHCNAIQAEHEKEQDSKLLMATLTFHQSTPHLQSALRHNLSGTSSLITIPLTPLVDTNILLFQFVPCWTLEYQPMKGIFILWPNKKSYMDMVDIHKISSLR
jgi:hypothetical protein